MYQRRKKDLQTETDSETSFVLIDKKGLGLFSGLATK